jgi:hypothetical protein
MKREKEKDKVNERRRKRNRKRRPVFRAKILLDLINLVKFFTKYLNSII